MYTTQGDLPHWHRDGKIFFVTFRLADSMPPTAVAEYKVAVERWTKEHGMIETKQDAEELERFKVNLLNKLLDKCLGKCVLKNFTVRDIVTKSLHHFDHQRYHIHDYVIMPNHVHLLIEPLEEWTIQKLMYSLKSYTAHMINKAIAMDGALWQHESYDRIIRNESHYYKVVNYIARNPRNFKEGDYALYLTNGRPDFKPIPNYALGENN